jgi:thioredoxin-like negative regulator of GroEL
MFGKKRKPHEALLRAAERAERAFQSKKSGELRQKARTAQQQKDWILTERLWRESLQADPGDRLAMIGLANALIYIGKNDEAARITATVTANWPADENGPLLRARLAEAEGDNLAAIGHWRAALTINPSWTQALTRLGRLLVLTRQFDEARKCAQRLSFLVPDNPAGDMLRADIETAEGHHDAAFQLRKALAEKHPRNAQLQRDYSQVLLAAGDHAGCEMLVAKLRASDPQHALWLEGHVLGERRTEQGHTDFWKAAFEAYPANTDFLRKYLHAALRDGRFDDARDAMKALLAQTPLRTSDASYVLGVVNLHDRHRDVAAIRALVRAFLKVLRTTSSYRLAAIRLSRIVFQYFPKAERPNARLPSDRLLGMLRGAPAFSHATQLIRRTAALQASLREDGGECLFDTDVSRSEAQKFVDHVRAHLVARKPFSFIRIDDGEGNAVPYGAEIAAFADVDAAERERVWWGRPLDAPQRAALNARVLGAMQAADALGIPTFSRILRDIRLDGPESFAQNRTGRGIIAVLNALEPGEPLRASRATRLLLTSAYVQHDLVKWELYRKLFDNVGEVIAVSCHPGLPQAMQNLFGVTIAQNIVIPPRHASLAAFGRSEMGPKILPDVLDDIIGQLNGDLAGRLVIVGAGYAGKCIVQAARERGGVALDLGSVLDYWLGIATRSYQIASLRVT